MNNLNNKLEHKHYWWLKNTLLRNYSKELLSDAFEKIKLAISKSEQGLEILPWVNDTVLERKHYWMVRDTLFKFYEYETLIKLIK